MKNLRFDSLGQKFKTLVVALMGLYGAFSLFVAHAAPTVDQSPLTVQATIPPNIVLMLDDSGSMAWNFMPDICYINGMSSYCSNSALSSQPNYNVLINSANNGVYYNPSVTYTPPPKATNTTDTSVQYVNSPGLTNAYVDGFNPTTQQDITQYAQVSTCSNSSPYVCSGAYETYLNNGGASVGKSNVPFSIQFPITTTTSNTQSPTCGAGYQLTGSGSATECVGKTVFPACSNGGSFSSATGQCISSSTPTCSIAGTSVSEPKGANKYNCNSVPTCNPTSSTYSQSNNSCTPSSRVTIVCPTGISAPAKFSGASVYTCNASAAPGCTNSGSFINTTGLCTAATSAASCTGGSVTLYGTSYQCVNATPSCNSPFVYAPSTGLCTQITSTTANYNFFQYATGSANTVFYVASAAQGCSTRTNCYLETDITGAAAPIGISVGQNVANWFSYYRTRILTAKSGLMNGFTALDPTIRVGFGSIDGSNASGLPSSTYSYADTYNNQTNYIATVQPFGNGSSGTQKANFWSWVVGEKASGGTPLRQALNAVGTYYTNVGPWQTSSSDSTELACRQSYTILTTDGFWNDSYSGVGDTDGAPGPTVSGPNGQSYTYSPALPYADSAQTQTVSNSYASMCPSGYSGPSSSGKCTKGTSSKTPSCNAGDTLSSNKLTCTHVVTQGVSNSNTLADVAMYYWKNDLRPADNEVPTSSEDPAFWQHMTTFTMGLGFTPVYSDEKTQIPVDSLFTWGLGGAIVPSFVTNGGWPTPSSAGTIENISDLAHAALNGHGGFYSATSPQSFASGIADAISRVETRVGTGASLAANSTKLATGTVTYQAYYNSGTWLGDLKAYSVDPSSGAISAKPSWSASDAMPAWGSRKIYTYNGSQFVQFSAPSALSTNQQNALGSTVANQQSVINYLLGDASNEQRNNGPYRNRRNSDNTAHPLGDIIDSQPVYVGTPNPNLYVSQTFTGAAAYAAFAADQASRNPVLWVAANDGILHGFQASDGTELYGYLPGAVLTNGIANLTNPTYGTSAAVPHQAYNDGQVSVADVYNNATSKWRTVLVGTTGRGNSETIYAIDITDPSSPTPLWEQSAGSTSPYSYIGQITSQPVIAQTANGVWSVLIGNGYNSKSGSDALLQFNVFSGSLSVNTTDGSTSNGLSSPAVWIGDPTNGVSTVAYAGDVLGNVWSFDLTSASTGVGKLLFTAKDAGNNRQPITGGLLAGKDPNTGNVWVFFGTGQYLTQSDLASTATQSWYGIIVQSGDSTLPAALSSGRSALIQRQIISETATTVTAGVTTLAGRVVSPGTPGDIAGKSGWYMDLLQPPVPGTQQGERMITPNQFQGDLLIGTTLIPSSSDPCNPSGSSWIMAINPFTGTNPSSIFFDLNGDGKFDTSDQIAATGSDGKQANFASAGVGFNSIANNPIFVGNTMLISFNTGNNGNVPTAGTLGAVKRLSWRELVPH